MDRLHRTRILFGNDGIAKLKRASVMVVGCGAVGSFAIEALARTGVGNLILVDFDKVEETNINRQLYALGSTIGKNKVDVATARIVDINPEIRVNPINLFFDTETNLNEAPDFVIDAIDSVPSKIALYKWCTERNIPFVASMGAARKQDPQQIKLDKLSKTKVCPLASKIRKLTRQENLIDFDVVYSTELPNKNFGSTGEFGSVITVTGTFGLLLANYVINRVMLS